MKYEYWNSFVLRRMYAKRRIVNNIGVVPEDARRVLLPSIIERVVGAWYVVNEVDKARIEGREVRAFWIAASKAVHEGRARYRSVGEMHSM